MCIVTCRGHEIDRSCDHDIILHMDCYHFCQQSEDHFEIAGANKLNLIPFDASSLRRVGVQYWNYHKHCFEEVQMTWAKCKYLLRKNLGDDRAFTNNIYSKFRQGP